MEIDWSYILGAIGTLLAAIALYAVRAILEKIKQEFENKGRVPSSKDFGTIILNDKMVMDVISELRMTMGANRAIVYQFHNGDHFSSNRPTWKISATHESCYQGIGYKTNRTKGIPCTSLLDMLLPSFGSQVKGVKRVDNVKDTYHIGVFWFVVKEMSFSMVRSCLEMSDVDYMVTTALIHPIDKDIIGLLSIEFCQDAKELEPEDAQSIMRFAAKVSYLLTMIDNQEKEGK